MAALSARNQLPGVVKSIKSDQVMSEVRPPPPTTPPIPGFGSLQAVGPTARPPACRPARGSPALRAPALPHGIRGGLLAALACCLQVIVQLEGTSLEVASVITTESVARLGLAENSKVNVVIKSTSVMLGRPS